MDTIWLFNRKGRKGYAKIAKEFIPLRPLRLTCFKILIFNYYS